MSLKIFFFYTLLFVSTKVFCYLFLFIYFFGRKGSLSCIMLVLLICIDLVVLGCSFTFMIKAEDNWHVPYLLFYEWLYFLVKCLSWRKILTTSLCRLTSFPEQHCLKSENRVRTVLWDGIASTEAHSKLIIIPSAHLGTLLLCIVKSNYLLNL